MSPKTLFAAAAALALSLAASAQAAPPASRFDPDIVSVRVPLIDLNLNHEAGARTALQRIRNAARQVCGDPSPSLLHQSARYRDCQRDAVDRAVATLGIPTVTAVNARGTGQVQVAGR